MKYRLLQALQSGCAEAVRIAHALSGHFNDAQRELLPRGFRLSSRGEIDAVGLKRAPGFIKRFAKKANCLGTKYLGGMSGEVSQHGVRPQKDAAPVSYCGRLVTLRLFGTGHPSASQCQLSAMMHSSKK